jgi:hypothetical protein
MICLSLTRHSPSKTFGSARSLSRAEVIRGVSMLVMLFARIRMLELPITRSLERFVSRCQ